MGKQDSNADMPSDHANVVQKGLIILSSMLYVNECGPKKTGGLLVQQLRRKVFLYIGKRVGC